MSVLQQRLLNGWPLFFIIAVFSALIMTVGIWSIGVTTAEADELVDNTVSDVSSFGLVDDTVTVDDTTTTVDDTDTGDEVEDEDFDCSGPLFSPVPPECI